MKNTIIITLLAMFTSTLSGQETKKIKEKKSGDIIIEYYVLKDNPSIKQGEYVKYKKHKPENTNIEKGTYQMGKKIGEWIYGELNYSNFYITENYNDSFQLTYKNVSDRYADTQHVYYFDNEQLVKEEIEIGLNKETKVYENGMLTQYVFSDYRGSKSYTYKDNQLIFYTIDESGYTKIGENTYSVKKSNPDVSGIEKLGKKEGIWTYKMNNEIKCFINYKNGKEVGMAVSLYPNGDTFCKKNHGDSVFLDSLSLRYKNGNVMFYSVFDSNETNVKRYFENGKLHQIAKIKKGKLVELETYNRDGNLVKEAIVKYGKGNFQLYDIDTDNFELMEECDISNGYYNGIFINYQKEENSTSTYVNGYKQSKEKYDTFQHTFGSTDFINFSAIDEEGYFSGGEDKLMQMVSNYFKMPRVASELGISGQIFIQFVIEKDGSISGIHSLNPPGRELGYGLEKECMRVISLTNGKWSPGLQFGFPVRSYWRFPFEVDNNSGF